MVLGMYMCEPCKEIITVDIFKECLALFLLNFQRSMQLSFPNTEK